MKKSQVLFAVMAAFALWVALVASGITTLSTESAVHAQGLAAARAQHAQPPRAPDLGRFTPTINIPQQHATAWKPKTSTAVTPKATTIASSTPSSTHAAATTRTPGEQKDLRTAASSTYLNADGSWTFKAYTEPVHYQDAQGVWHTIDTSIVADTTDPGYAYANKANSWHIHFAQQSGGPNLVHGNLANGEYFETIAGAASVNATTSGSQIVYPDIFPNVDAVYTMMHAHLEETLLLHSAAVPASFTLAYHVPGATAQQDQGGNIIFTDAKGTIVLVVSAPIMFESDANGQMLPKGAGTDKVTMTLAGSGPDYTATLTPNAQWLADPSRKFPVAIDPMYDGVDNYTNTTNGNIYADTVAESGNPTTLFYNLNSERAGNCNALPSNALGYGNGVDRSYIKFPAMDGRPTPGTFRVTGATLGIWQTSAYAGATQLNVEEIQNAWNSVTTDWNNRPVGNPMKTYTTTSTNYNVWDYIDASAVAYDWWEGGVANNGISLKLNNENVACDFFASDNYGGYLPTLSINYVGVDGTAPTAGIGVSVQNPYSVNGTQFTNSTSAQITSAFSDPSATTDFTSNWSSVSGVAANAYWTAPNYTVNGSQITADTSTCGTSSCAVNTFFTKTESNMTQYPTFTSMFQSDLAGNFYFGVAKSGDPSTRFDLIAPAGGSAFTTLNASIYQGSYSSFSINIPFTANTWYYGQVTFPLPTVGQIYIWPAGQAKPASPSITFSGLTMANPGLNFYEYGSNGAGTHHYSIGPTVITSGSSSGTIAYGAWGLQYSNDQSNWSCPSPGGTWCVANDQVALPWTLSAGDGAKTVYARSVDNQGLLSGSTPSSCCSIALDQTPPTASITSPAAGREVRGAVIVTAQATDPVVNGVSSGMKNIWLYVDGQQAGLAQSGSTPSFMWDTTGYAPGPHTLSVIATDNLGNSFTSPGVTVDVANTGQYQYNTYAIRNLPDNMSAGANVADGDAVVVQQDLAIPGRGPQLSVTRTYNSLAPINNLFGWGWTSELDEGLIANSDGSVTYRDPDGGLHLFAPNGSGGFSTSPGLFQTLTHNADGTYTLMARDQSKTNFNSSGYIASVVDRDGNTLTVSYTGSTPTTVTDATGRTLTITISGGHIIQITDPGARTYQYAYDGSNNLVSYTDPAGTVTQYTYDSAHHLTQIVAGYVSGATPDSETNVKTVLTYDTEGRLAQVLDPMTFDANFDYGSTGSLLTKVYQLQTGPTNTTPSTTNSEYELTTYTLPSDGSGAVTTITDPFGAQYQYQYNGNEQVTQVTDPGDSTNPSKVTAYTYDANGNELTQTVDPNGLGLQTSWTYDSGNNVVTETDPANVVTQYTYDSPATGNVTQTVKNYVSGGAVTSDQNVTTQYTYDSAGDLLTQTAPPDANGTKVVTQYTYDPSGYGNVTQTVKNYVSGGAVTSDQNVTTSATYNALGEKTTSTDALGHVTQYTYDALGDVTKTIENYQASGASDSETNVTTNDGYDSFGRQVTQANPRGYVTLTVYDENGRVIKTVQNSVSGVQPDSQTNVTTTTAYDAAGNATLTTDPQGNKTTTTYDADNRAIEVVVSNSGTNTVTDKKTIYDLAGQVTQTQVIDPATGNIVTATYYTYDAAGRQSTQTEPPTDSSAASNVTTTSYDQNGNPTGQAVTNANVTGDVTDTTMQYDALGRVTQKTADANTSAPQTTSYSYAANGVQTSVTAPASSGTTTTENSYDALGQLLSQIQAYGTSNAQTTNYTYDAAGETLSISNADGTTSYSFDALGRTLTQTQDNSAGVTQTSIANTYDNNGNLLTSSASYGSGASVVMTFSYDPLDRQFTLSDGNRTYTYDSNGNVTNMLVKDPSTSASIVQQSSAYDGGNRLTDQTDTAGPSNVQLHTYNYTYSAAGDRSSASADGTLTNYTYDASHQLLSEASGASTISYTYDHYNNRSSMVTSAGTTSYGYDSTTHTELTLKTDPSGKSTAYTYDPSGNLTKAVYDASGANQTTSYTYDSANRLSSVTEPDGTSVSFTYNAAGQRASTIVTTPGAGSTTVNDYYQLGRLAYQTDGSGTLLATYTYDMAGVPVSVQVGSGTSAQRYYYVYDARGDVVNLTDSNGNVVASYAYDTWGNLTSASENIPNANGWVNPFRFDGRDGVRYDASTGLDWMAVRAYDPSVGRFLSRDPLGRAPLFFADNPYVYAGNNPLSNVDPSGQYRAAGFGSKAHESWKATKKMMARVVSHRGTPSSTSQGTSSVGNCSSCGTNAAPTPRPVAHLSFPVLLDISIKPDWWNVDALIDFAFATVYLGLAVTAILAAIAVFNEDPIAGLAAVANAVDFFLHGAAYVFHAVFGASSGLYQVTDALAAVFDVVATFADGVALFTLGADEVAANMTLPLLKNVKVLGAIQGFLGIDLLGLLSDVKAGVHQSLP